MRPNCQLRVGHLPSVRNSDRMRLTSGTKLGHYEILSPAIVLG